MSALELYEAARKAAALLPDGASITLSCRANEATVRELAALFGVEAKSHVTIWPNHPPSVIYSTETEIDKVRVSIQGSRPATVADAADGASLWVDSKAVSSAEAQRVLESTGGGK